MEKKEQIEARSKMKSVTVGALAANLVLFGLKLTVGILSGSVALVADGIHSFSDMATDLSVILGIHFGAREPDQSHPYGHGRAETFAALFVSLFLLAVGVGMIYYAAVGIAHADTVKPRFVIVVVALVSIVVKELLFRVTKAVAVKYHSAALYANAWHHRSDALSSVAVVIGFILLEFGFGHGDQVAAIAVGMMIIWVGVRIISDAIRELTEAAVDPDTIEHIKNVINSDSSIRQWHKLRTRTVGREVFLDLHILVDPDLKITAAHEITERLEMTLDEKITRPINITVHIEPDTPELRK